MGEKESVEKNRANYSASVCSFVALNFLAQFSHSLSFSDSLSLSLSHSRSPTLNLYIVLYNEFEKRAKMFQLHWLLMGIPVLQGENASISG